VTKDKYKENKVENKMKKINVLEEVKEILIRYQVTFPDNSKEDLKSALSRILKRRELNDFQKRVNSWRIQNNYSTNIYFWILFSEYPDWILNDYKKGKIGYQRARKQYSNSVRIPKEQKFREVDKAIINFIGGLNDYLGENEI
jgi:hypothetical protein